MTEARRRVVFIGGSAYSGSTLLDLILGNDPAGFSVGEVANFFNPTAKHHLSPSCGCGRADCTTWPQLRRAGPNELYRCIFAMHPDVQFVVDSSKDPFWIEHQSRLLRKQGIETSHVLIWKAPRDIALSYAKRGIGDRWERSWVNYHRLYSRLTNDWIGVRYDRLTDDPAVLPRLCERVGLRYFDGKEQYWQKRHCILGGNHAALVHLHDPGSPAFERSNAILERDTRERVTPNLHRRIAREAAAIQTLHGCIDEQVRTSRYVGPLLEVLEARDVMHCRIETGAARRDVEFSRIDVFARRMSRRIKLLRGRVRFAAA